MAATINQRSTASEVKAAASLQDANAWRHFLKGTQQLYRMLKNKHPHVDSWWLIPFPEQKEVIDATVRYLEEKGVQGHTVNDCIINWRMTQQFKQLAAKPSPTHRQPPPTPPSSQPYRGSLYDPVRDISIT